MRSLLFFGVLLTLGVPVLGGCKPSNEPAQIEGTLDLPELPETPKSDGPEE